MCREVVSLSHMINAAFVCVFVERVVLSYIDLVSLLGHCGVGLSENWNRGWCHHINVKSS